MRLGEPGSVSLGTEFDFTGTAPFTFEAWIHADLVDTTYRHVFMKNFGDGTGLQKYGIYLQGDVLAFERYVDGAGVKVVAAASTVVGRWAHVVSVYDGTKDALWIDGVLVDQAVDLRSQPEKPGAIFYVGAREPSYGVFPGAIDEVAIYGSALSPGRIKAHFDAAKR
jgi:hypothetical protein